MGAELMFRADKEATRKEVVVIADWFYEESETNKKLKRIKEGFAAYLNSDVDILIAKRENPHMVSFFKQFHGKGSIKVNGIDPDDLADAGVTDEEVFELWTKLFEEANAKFPGKMRYYLGSCAFVPGDEGYFSDEQVARITQGGVLFSGQKKGTSILKSTTSISLFSQMKGLPVRISQRRRNKWRVTSRLTMIL